MLSGRTEAAIIDALDNLTTADSGGGNKLQRITQVINAIKRDWPEESDRLIIGLIGEALSRKWKAGSPAYQLGLIPNRHAEILELLRVEGWDFVDGRLVPSGPAPTDLAREVEDHLALSEVSQETVPRGKLCQRMTNTRLDGTSALQRLQQAGRLETGEFNLARGLFDCVQSRGAHAGLSHEEEARFRLHFATALARYLLLRFDAVADDPRD